MRWGRTSVAVPCASPTGVGIAQPCDCWTLCDRASENRVSLSYGSLWRKRVVRRYKTAIFIDKDPNDPFKGWGWVDIDREIVQRFAISAHHPQARLSADGNCYIQVPSRGKAGGKKFVVNTDNEVIYLSVQKSLTTNAVCYWVKSWASLDARVTTPGNRIISLAGEPISKNSAFVYFVLNSDSNAIKIGKAKDIQKRLQSLQTVSPAKLQLLKAVQVMSELEARTLESSLHRKFALLRITGEWFRADKELVDYMSDL